MARLPERPNFEHLMKQAKDLLRLYEAKDVHKVPRIPARRQRQGRRGDHRYGIGGTRRPVLHRARIQPAVLGGIAQPRGLAQQPSLKGAD